MPQMLQIMSIVFRIALMLYFCVSMAHCQLLPAQASVADKIFEESEIIILYVDEAKNSQANDVLQLACQQKITCALIDPEHHQYDQISRFLGYGSTPHLAIIDTQQQLKFVIPISSALTQSDVLQFWENYDKSQLEPYYASEQLPTYNQTSKCLRLVGKNYQNFLTLDPPIKIVYLYSSDLVCQSCPQILARFRRLAQKHHSQDLLLFGYLDVSLNDSPYVRDEIFPYFLIYFLDNFEDPYGVEAQEFSQLDLYITEMKKQIEKHMTIQEQAERQGRQQSQLIQGHDDDDLL